MGLPPSPGMAVEKRNLNLARISGETRKKFSVERRRLDRVAPTQLQASALLIPTTSGARTRIGDPIETTVSREARVSANADSGVSPTRCVT